MYGCCSVQVIVFALSKRQCEQLAMNLSHMHINSIEEAKLVDAIFWSAMDILPPQDRTLPQVTNALPMLRRGVGVHHSGLLPIVKEAIEVLFAEGLIKVCVPAGSADVLKRSAHFNCSCCHLHTNTRLCMHFNALVLSCFSYVTAPTPFFLALQTNVHLYVHTHTCTGTNSSYKRKGTNSLCCRSSLPLRLSRLVSTCPHTLLCLLVYANSTGINSATCQEESTSKCPEEQAEEA